MFEAAQEDIGRVEFRGSILTKNFALGQQFQHLLRRLYLQVGISPAANELEHLGDEFDFSNAAGTELDVVSHVLFRHFATDLGVQFAHRIDRAEIEILAKDKRMADLVQLVVAAAGQRSRLDPGIALPFPALGDQVVLQHLERAHQRAGIAVGPQAHVHPKHLAVFRDIGDRVDQAASETGKEFEVRDRARPVRIPVFGKYEYQVNVRRHIQLASAELAHADHDQFLTGTIGTARRTVALDETGTEHVHRLLQGQFGEQRHALGHLRHRCQAGQIACGDTGIGALLELAQYRLQIGFVGGLRAKPRHQILPRDRLLQSVRNLGCQGRFGGQQTIKVTGCCNNIGEGGHRLEFAS